MDKDRFAVGCGVVTDYTSNIWGTCDGDTYQSYMDGGGWNILDACSAPRNALGGDALNRLAVIGGQSG